MLGTVLSAVTIVISDNPYDNPSRENYYPHFTDGRILRSGGDPITEVLKAENGNGGPSTLLRTNKHKF